MRIAIATIGRYHVLDLARELVALGHDVSFWSLVPRKRALAFGLPDAAYRRMPFRLLLLIAAQRFGPRRMRTMATEALLAAADRCIARRLKPCDAFIGMSGLAVQSAVVARKRYGAKIFIERGSRHILSQRTILEDIARVSTQAERVHDYSVSLHQASTSLADVVVVPSLHVKVSFLEHGYPEAKLFVNPYGVDLSMFTPTPAPSFEQLTVIFVGLWSYRKGCNILCEAIARFQGRIRLMHVGMIGDAPIPTESWFEHHDPVPQPDLVRFYAESHVFVLASLEEGLALVQAQALACGLPIVCTDRTGGEDLIRLTHLQEGVFVVPNNNVEALQCAISDAFAWTQQRFRPGHRRDLLGDSRDLLSWRRYAERYSAKLTEVFENGQVQGSAGSAV